MKVEKIYFDMDDTLADFSRGIREICKLEHWDQDTATKEQDDEMWQAVKEQSHFYRRLEEVPAGVALFRKLNCIYDYVEILTAVPSEKRNIKGAVEDKRVWVIEHLDKDHLGSGIEVHAVRPADEKNKYANNKGCILIDDRQQNIDAWEAAGGTGFLFNKDHPEETIKALEEEGIVSQLAYTNHSRYDYMDLEEYLRYLLENTDKEGNLYLPVAENEVMHPQIEDYFRYQMDWTAKDIDELVQKIERAKKAAAEITQAGISSDTDPEEAKEKLSASSYRIWEVFLKGSDDIDYDDRIPEIEEKANSILFAREYSQEPERGENLDKDTLELYESSKDTALTPEEEKILDNYYASLDRAAVKRLGEGVNAADVLCRFNRCLKLVEMGIAPDIVLVNEWHQFARALAIFDYCNEAEYFRK